MEMDEIAAKPDCIFCAIIAGHVSGHIVDEDDDCVTFMDAFPAAPGHTLIVTRQHYCDLLHAPPAAIAAVAAKSVAVAQAVKSVMQAEGIGVFQLNGAAAGQTVFHYHLHLIPRNRGEQLQIHSRVAGEPRALAQLAARLRQHLAPA
jgi:histidine triad (HIT) family protein